MISLENFEVEPTQFTLALQMGTIIDRSPSIKVEGRVIDSTYTNIRLARELLGTLDDSVARNYLTRIIEAYSGSYKNI